LRTNNEKKKFRYKINFFEAETGFIMTFNFNWLLSSSFMLNNFSECLIKTHITASSSVGRSSPSPELDHGVVDSVADLKLTITRLG
jgi:hypothetical protein